MADTTYQKEIESALRLVMGPVLDRVMGNNSISFEKKDGQLHIKFEIPVHYHEFIKEARKFRVLLHHLGIKSYEEGPRTDIARIIASVPDTLDSVKNIQTGFEKLVAEEVVDAVRYHTSLLQGEPSRDNVVKRILKTAEKDLLPPGKSAQR